MLFFSAPWSHTAFPVVSMHPDLSEGQSWPFRSCRDIVLSGWRAALKRSTDGWEGGKPYKRSPFFYGSLFWIVTSIRVSSPVLDIQQNKSKCIVLHFLSLRCITLFRRLWRHWPCRSTKCWHLYLPAVGNHSKNNAPNWVSIWPKFIWQGDSAGLFPMACGMSHFSFMPIDCIFK